MPNEATSTPTSDYTLLRLALEQSKELAASVNLLLAAAKLALEQMSAENKQLRARPAHLENQQPAKFVWEQWIHFENGPIWREIVKDYDPRLAEYSDLHPEFSAETVRNFRPLFARPVTEPKPEDVITLPREMDEDLYYIVGGVMGAQSPEQCGRADSFWDKLVARADRDARTSTRNPMPS